MDTQDSFDEAKWQQEFDALNAVAEVHNIKYLSWSCNIPASELNAPHAFQGITHVKYEKYPVKTAIKGTTWLDIWKASDACFKRNLLKFGRWYPAMDDCEAFFALDDHTFIESFVRVRNVLVVECGS
jgi:hypothetical protein